MSNGYTPERPNNKRGKRRHLQGDSWELQAILEGNERYRTREEALAKVRSIQKRYECRKRQDDDPEDEITLWVSGFGVSNEDWRQGLRGNFARIWVETKHPDRWDVRVERIDVPRDRHPVRGWPADADRSHPTWSDRFLRDIKAERTFASLEDIKALTQRLREEFPKAVQVPSDRLFLADLYSQRYKAEFGRPVARHTFEVREYEDGWKIEWAVRPNKEKTDAFHADALTESAFWKAHDAPAPADEQ